MDAFKEKELTEVIIRSFYKVYNNLGFGFLEKVYENALKIELIKSNLIVESQQPLKVFYENYQVGSYFADLVVNDKVILELKADEILHPAHEAQLVNYLRETDIEVGLLLNFGKRPQLKRKIWSNSNPRKSACHLLITTTS
ncbi:MAG: GxxExxY protein [Candidatus Dojkabacteria bacterium]|nr:GxxExxY protein [Candidatus Dojkabacteria bacterium]MDQ7021165.1 GxxExxY protein [Candidatus Dojkabacteria bacterium]